MTTALGPAVLREMPLPQHEGSSDKEGRGRVLIIGSSLSVPGAVLLSGEAALRAGAGKLQLAVPRMLSAAIGVAFPESGVISLPETQEGEPSAEAWEGLLKPAAAAGSVLIGPGLMDKATSAHIVGQLLENIQSRFVLDAAAMADALMMAALIQNQKVNVVLTPHSGEMASMLKVSKDTVEADPESYARSAAKRLGGVVALKGATTFIADPAGNTWRNDGGVIGLGTCGSGDVLSGLIAGLLARGAAPVTASLWGVYIHSRVGSALAARIGRLGFIAREILSEIPGEIETLSLDR
jgi:ADP-dependent NAD(P)H-hydrate dehydratase